MGKETVPIIEVGIVTSERIRFSLKGRFTMPGGEEFISGKAEACLKRGSIKIIQSRKIYGAGDSVILKPEEKTKTRFIIREVMIGIGFHWEQKEDQEFRGALKLAVSGNGIQVINLISVEEYLISVISSEMRGDSLIELLKAHTIISRSWLLAQIGKKDNLTEEDKPYQPIYHSDEEYIRWYDREDHDEFHVCADDHCQRYQGISRAYHPAVVNAVKETTGEVLVYEGSICDARFSKCCGGVVEKFEYCWEPVSHPYLQRVDDNPESMQTNTDDLKIESNAVRFIKATPRAFCNTNDGSLLRQVLNDYDQNFKDFFRWKVAYTQEELSGLILKKSGIDFGGIIDLEPVERGESGRLVKLKIVGTKKTLTIGKELEIRRWLSDSHLYSAAFIVEKQKISNGIPGLFILLGAGWGHGVGLCQIGAAVMANKGYSHKEILSHYFIGTTIEKRYE
jgi:SpoIID/LytB domain protein